MMTYEIGNPGPELGQPQKCGGVNPMRKMQHTIYVTRIILRPLSALFGLQFMLPIEKSVTFTGACATEIIPNG
jgi:hypothetical protein